MTDIALSNDEVQAAVPEMSTCRYRDLVGLSAQDIWESLPIMILYETSVNSGHWTLLHQPYGGGDEVIEFFDSLGYRPDGEFEFIDEITRHELSQVKPFIVKTLLELSENGFEIEYNDHKLQYDSPNIATCGRWCIIRHLLKELDIDEFAQKMDEVAKFAGVSKDGLTALLTPDLGMERYLAEQ